MLGLERHFFILQVKGLLSFVINIDCNLTLFSDNLGIRVYSSVMGLLSLLCPLLGTLFKRGIWFYQNNGYGVHPGQK